MKRFALIPALLVFLLLIPACSKDSKSPPGSGGGDPYDIQGITFVSIPGGTFQMGDVEGGEQSDEKPVHMVTLSGFEMSVYEITNTQYAAYLNAAKASGAITATSSSVTGTAGAYSNQEYIYLTRILPIRMRGAG